MSGNFRLDNRLIVFTIAVGLLGGVLAGLFGVGGGLIMVPLLVGWLRLDQKTAHATSLAAVVPITIAGTLGFAQTGHVDWQSAAYLLCGSVLGAFVGARSLRSFSTKYLYSLFGLLLVASGLRLLWNAEPTQIFSGIFGHAFLLFAGLIAGVLAGLLGIGGGVVVIPALICASGIDSLSARGTSLAVAVGTSIVGALTHMHQKNVDNRVALLMGFAGVPATFLGVYVSHDLSSNQVTYLFAVLLIGLGVQQGRSAMANR